MKLTKEQKQEIADQQAQKHQTTVMLEQIVIL